jgi:hypothetical protein
MEKRNVDETATHFAPIWRGAMDQDEAENEDEHYYSINTF